MKHAMTISEPGRRIPFLPCGPGHGGGSDFALYGKATFARANGELGTQNLSLMVMNGDE